MYLTFTNLLRAEVVSCRENKVYVSRLCKADATKNPLKPQKSDSF